MDTYLEEKIRDAEAAQLVIEQQAKLVQTANQLSALRAEKERQQRAEMLAQELPALNAELVAKIEQAQANAQALRDKRDELMVAVTELAEMAKAYDTEVKALERELHRGVIATLQQRYPAQELGPAVAMLNALWQRAIADRALVAFTDDYTSAERITLEMLALYTAGLSRVKTFYK